MAVQCLGDSALRFLETALRFFETALRFFETALRFLETALRFLEAALRFFDAALRRLDSLQCGPLDLERCVECFADRRQGFGHFVICHDFNVLPRAVAGQVIF